MVIYEVLKNDHEKVLALLDEILGLSSDDKKRHTYLINQVSEEMIPHARAEEAVFYNALRSLQTTQDIALQGFEQHMEAELLLRKLQFKDKIDGDWKRTAEELRQSLQEHIQFEEGQMFSVAQEVFTNEEAQQMTFVFEQVKPQVREEGFIRKSLDVVANLMPPRIAATWKTYNLGTDKTVNR